MTRVRGTVGRAERAEALQCALQCLPVLDRRRDDPDRHRQEEPDVVTAQLDKLVPLLEESWTSSDGHAAVSSTKDLSSTLSQKAQQLHDSSQALQAAKKGGRRRPDVLV